MGMNNHKHDNDAKKSSSSASSNYEKSFEDLLGKSKVSEEETRRRDELLKEKMKLDKEAQAKYEQDKAKVESRKQQDFEDLLSGKKKSTDDMTLGELFKEFYGRAKEVDTSKYVNSAKTSLNSFSSLLEKRRQAAQKQEEKKAESKVQDKAAASTSEEEIKKSQ